MWGAVCRIDDLRSRARAASRAAARPFSTPPPDARPARHAGSPAPCPPSLAPLSPRSRKARMFASSSSCPVAPRLLPKSAPSRGRRGQYARAVARGASAHLDRRQELTSRSFPSSTRLAPAAASAPSYRQVEAAERRLVGSVSAPQPSGSSSSAASVVPASSPSSAGSSSQRQPGPSSPVASPIGRSSFAPIGQPPHCSTSRYWALSSPAGLDLSDRRAFSSAPPSRSSSCAFRPSRRCSPSLRSD